ncbi:MAG: type II secretion system protein [Candidatus Paceibacterota bacterium]
MSGHLLKYNRGMTLVELLVVLSIFAIISMTVAFNYSSYKSTTSTNVLAQDVALSIREAQGYAMGVKSVSSAGSSIFPGYGVHFSPSGSGPISGSSKSFILFADIPFDINNPQDKGDSEYGFPVSGGANESACDGSVLGSDNECISVITISGGDKILGVCANSECEDLTPNPNGSLDIVFRRPNPDAVFCYRANVGDISCANEISSVGIIVQSESDQNILKKIVVWNTGQISVE